MSFPRRRAPLRRGFAGGETIVAAPSEPGGLLGADYEVVELTVAPSVVGPGARMVRVVPIDNELALRHRDWVEGNLA